MKEVQDRVVQFSNRYKLTDVATGEVLGTYDFTEVPGTVKQVGTEIDAELFKNFAQIDGNYPSLMSGGVVAVDMTSATDINDFYGADYWGKEFYCTGGNQPINSPPRAYGGCLQVLRAGYNTTYQVYRVNSASDSSNKPTTWQRAHYGSISDWTDWEEIVTSDGSYPALGAGYLQGFTTSTASSTGGKGWVHFAKIDGTKISRSYSLILLISGRYNVGTVSTAAPSGLLEIESYVDPTAHTFNTKTGTNIKILAGEITPNDFCFVNNGTSLDLYIYFGDVYGNSYITKLSETAAGINSGEAFVTTAVTTDNTFYGTSAPANAVYAVVRNIASYAESIPAASQTVLGGAKMWVSNGKLYIKTT